jgi:hypothetical protein
MDLTKRHWNDFKTLPDLQKGPFNPAEIRLLRDLLCQWAQKHALSPEELVELCSDTKNRSSTKVWCSVAKHFPKRSVQSIHNVCRRIFNPNNYKGEWAHWEEQELVHFVKQNGHKWKEIGEILGRTAVNVKDKWKQMGGDKQDCRKKGAWSGGELVSLIRLVQQNSGISAVPSELLTSCEGLKDEEAVFARIGTHLQAANDLAAVKDLNWNAIAHLLVTRSEVDCRLKWNRCVLGKITTADSFTSEEDMKLITGIEEQGAEDLSEIRWERLETGRSARQNRARFRTLFNVICGRLRLTLEEVLKQLKHAYTVYEEEDGSIVDFYKKHYFMHK